MRRFTHGGYALQCAPASVHVNFLNNRHLLAYVAEGSLARWTARNAALLSVLPTQRAARLTVLRSAARSPMALAADTETFAAH